LAEQMRAIQTAVFGVACAFALGACASKPAARADAAAAPQALAKTPDWFVKRKAELKAAAYPKLTDVPEAPKGGRSATDWDALTKTIQTEGARLMADPNNAPAKVEDVDAFEAEARKVVTPPPSKP
jgi:hypothetical protein